MNRVFVDTSGWASGFVPTETYHSIAKQVITGAGRGNSRLITTNYVITELVALLTSPFRVPRAEQIRIIDSLSSVDWIEIIHVDPTLHQEAWQLLQSRLDKNWSLVDCASFVVMEQRGMTEALTTDHHFEQAGYVRLLK